jgi:hypothetical protein
MRIDNMKGEFLYRAARRLTVSQFSWETIAFHITSEYYRSKEDAQLDGYETLWPVDEIATGVMYIPDSSEFND